jgi:hypothetical protein
MKTVYYIDEDLSIKASESKRSSFKNIIKYILRIFFGKSIFKYKNKLFLNEKLLNNINKELFNIIVKENIESYRVQNSRTGKIYNEISDINPAVLYNDTFNFDRFTFSIFLNQNIKNLNEIVLYGYYIVEGKKILFKQHLDKEKIKGFSKPSYWMSFEICIEESAVDTKNKIKIVLNKIDMKGVQINSKTRIISPFYINNAIKQQTKKSFVFSFDGITAEDIFLNTNSNLLFPNINKFKNDNYNFLNAITSSTVTASSAASLITGLNLFEHQIHAYNDYYLSPGLVSLSTSAPTIGQKMLEKNIITDGIFAFGRWAPQYGFSRGFNNYQTVNSGAIQNFPWLEFNLKSIQNTINNSSVFMMHHPGGHPPYLTKVNNQYQDIEYSAYIENLRYIDTFFGVLIKYLKDKMIYDDSLIIFIADHGRSLSGEFSRKKYQFTEERLRVPCIIKNPNWNEKSQIDLEKYISTQSFIYNSVCDFMDVNNSERLAAEREIDGITWTCETIDYTTNDTVGMVGYKGDEKYVVYYSINFESNQLGALSSLKMFTKDNFGKFNLKDQKIEGNKKILVNQSAIKYIKNSLKYAKIHPTQKMKNHTYIRELSYG